MELSAVLDVSLFTPFSEAKFLDDETVFLLSSLQQPAEKNVELIQVLRVRIVHMKKQ